MATILIVDDEGPVRNFLSILLKDTGHLMLQAINGADALRQVEKNHPDLIISDIMMPVLSGTELCRKLKSDEATKRIPLILMSSANVRAADRAGADAFIAKPFDLEEMEALVERLLPLATPNLNPPHLSRVSNAGPPPLQGRRLRPPPALLRLRSG